jgi:hypothetical protein
MNRVFITATTLVRKECDVPGSLEYAAVADSQAAPVPRALLTQLYSNLINIAESQVVI